MLYAASHGALESAEPPFSRACQPEYARHVRARPAWVLCCQAWSHGPFQSVSGPLIPVLGLRGGWAFYLWRENYNAMGWFRVVKPR